MAEMIKISDLPPAAAALASAIVPATQNGETVKLTIGQALDILVDGAPAGLDTLNELAAALDILSGTVDGKLDSSSYTAADILAKLITVDGSASGLDADLFRGLEPDSFILDSDIAAPGAPPLFAVRAWVNFDGTTASIRGSGNVSSITYDGTGLWTVNFTTPMPDLNYAAVVTIGALTNTASALTPVILTRTVNSIQIQTRDVADVNRDTTYVAVAVVR